MLLNGAGTLFSLPLRKGSDTLDVVQRELAADFNRSKLLNQFKEAYSKAPYFAETFQLLQRIIDCKDVNLFNYIYLSLVEICRHLKIDAEIRTSSTIPIDHALKAQDKVLALCEELNVDTYINTTGGTALYDKGKFRSRGIELQFIKAKEFEYPQFFSPFVPWLSIIDVLMFNPLDVVQDCIHSNFELN